MEGLFALAWVPSSDGWWWNRSAWRVVSACVYRVRTLYSSTPISATVGITCSRAGMPRGMPCSSAGARD
eukprot:3630173-Prorocentrum_lima.AAC.1